VGCFGGIKNRAIRHYERSYSKILFVMEGNFYLTGLGIQNTKKVSGKSNPEKMQLSFLVSPRNISPNEIQSFCWAMKLSKEHYSRLEQALVLKATIPHVKTHTDQTCVDDQSKSAFHRPQPSGHSRSDESDTLDKLQSNKNVLNLPKVPDPKIAHPIRTHSTKYTRKNRARPKIFRPPIKRRHRMTPKQKEILNNGFEKNPYPNCLSKVELAEAASLTKDQVQTWFQNNRARLRKNNTQVTTGTNKSGGNAPEHFNGTVILFPEQST
jgi:hypothetical protein